MQSIWRTHQNYVVFISICMTLCCFCRRRNLKWLVMWLVMWAFPRRNHLQGMRQQVGSRRSLGGLWPERRSSLCHQPMGPMEIHMEVMEEKCAPENWMVSSPFPIKDPISRPWCHGGMVVLHLLGWPIFRSAKCEVRQVKPIGSSRTPGAFNGEKTVSCYQGIGAPGGCVIINMDNRNSIFMRFQWAEWDPEQWVFFLCPRSFPTFSTLLVASCGRWDVNGCHGSATGSVVTSIRVSPWTLFQLFGDYDIIIYSYDKHPRGAGISFSIQILHGMTSDFHP